MSTASGGSGNQPPAPENIDVSTKSLQMTVEEILAFVCAAIFGAFSVYLGANLLWRYLVKRPLIVGDPDSDYKNSTKIGVIIATIVLSGAAGAACFAVMQEKSKAMFNDKIDLVKASDFECFVTRTTSDVCRVCDVNGENCEDKSCCDRCKDPSKCDDTCLHASNNADECKREHGGAENHGGNPKTKDQQVNLLEQERDEVRDNFIIYLVCYVLVLIGLVVLVGFQYDAFMGKDTAASTDEDTNT